MRILLSAFLLLSVTACADLKGALPNYTVNFATGKHSLDAKARAVIAEAAKEINSGSLHVGAPWKNANCFTKIARSCNGGYSSVTLIGFADTVGKDSSNQSLSEKRAAAVRQRLIQDGVAEVNIQSFANGETNLPVKTSDNVSEPQNRRVEIYIY